MKQLMKYRRLLKQKPSLLISGVRQLIGALVLKKKLLRGVEFAVTYECQARCGKCSCRSLVDGSRRELTLGGIKEIARQLIEAGALFINLTGGEPLLRKDIIEIIASFQRLPVLTSLSTNALLLSEPLLTECKKAGLHLLQVNLGSPFAVEHNREIGSERGFAQAVMAVKAARSKGIEVMINLVVTREVIHSERLAKMVAIAGKNRSFLSLVMPAKVGGWSNRPVALREPDYLCLARWLKLPWVVTDTDSCFKQGACPAGTEKVYISPYGDLYPCPFIQTSAGNILTHGFMPLWSRMSAHQRNKCVNVV